LLIFFVIFTLLLVYFNNRFILISLVFDIILSIKESKNKLMRNRFRKIKTKKSINFLSTITIVSILIVKLE